MHLYLLVWECEEYAEEAEWLHFVSDKDVIEYDDQIIMATKFMQEQNGDGANDDTFNITNIWLNSVTSVEGYKVSLEREV
jgi:hypothetical protein